MMMKLDMSQGDTINEAGQLQCAQFTKMKNEGYCSLNVVGIYYSCIFRCF